MSIRGNFWDVTDADWEYQVNVNYRSPFILAQHVARQMIERGIRGRIVNTSTIGARACHANAAVYDSAKGAVEVMTRQLAVEAGPHGITVNAICPGFIVTNATRELAAAGKLEEVRRRTPFRRLGTPEDVAGAVLFLASEDAGFITGAELLVDGGIMAMP